MNENERSVPRTSPMVPAPRAARAPEVPPTPAPPNAQAPTPIPSPSPSSGFPPTDSHADEGSGRLIFRVTTGKGAIPLPGARVTLWSRRPDWGTDRGNTVAVLITDRDGRTEAISLPAPAKKLSLAPSAGGVPAPFACYDAEVLLEGYYTVSYVCIPVFDGITSIQPADLIPLPENGYADGQTPEDTVIVEGENPRL